jgi:hypothetical protein
MNIALRSFVEEQIKLNPSVKLEFANHFVNERLEPLHISKYIDKDYKSLNTAYYHTDDHLKDCVKEPFLFLTTVRYKGLSEKIWTVLKHNPVNIVGISLESQTKAMIDYCLRKVPALIAYVNPELIDRDLSTYIVDKEPMLFEFLPDQFKNYKNAHTALSKDIRVIRYLPSELIDDFVKERVLNHDEYILDYVPYEALDINMITNQIIINPLDSANQCMKLAIENNDYSLFSLIMEYINVDDDRKENSLTAIFSPPIFTNEIMVQFLNEYLRENPKKHILFDKNFLGLDTIKMLIDGNFDFTIPKHYWAELYPHLYNTSSSYIFDIPNEYHKLVENHKDKWTNLWINLYSEAEQRPYLSPIFLSNDLIEDEDVWLKIESSRLIYQIKQDYKLSNFDDLKQITANNTHPIELKKIKDEIDKELKYALVLHDIFWWFTLDTDQINEENTLKLIKTYPKFAEYIPPYLKTEKFINKAISEEPIIAEYL